MSSIKLWELKKKKREMTEKEIILICQYWMVAYIYIYIHKIPNAKINVLPHLPLSGENNRWQLY